MLSYEELLSQIKQLPGQTRLALLEEIAHSLREELASENKEASSETSRPSSLDRLYGILKTGNPAQSDEEIRDDYIDYLSKKYA